MATLNFDATTVEPVELLPAGWYPVIITESEMRSNKEGTGSYLYLKMVITEGERKGFCVFDRLNLFNPNADAVRIARQSLSALCRAVGVLQPKDSCELHNLPFMVKVGLQKWNDDDSNVVKGYRAKGAASAQGAPQTAANQTAAPWN